MKRGRPPKPTTLRIREGNREHRAINMSEPNYSAAPEPPEWMTPDAKMEWFRLAPDLLSQGLLTKADTSAFASYCEETAAYARLSRKISDLLTQKKPKQDVLVRLMRLRASTFKNLNVALSKFGFSPADRTRITAQPAQAEENSLRAMLKPLVS